MHLLKKVNLLILLAFSVAFVACSKNKKNKTKCFLSENYSNFPYSLNSPSETFVLDKELREISGLSFQKGNKLLCINDEQGSIFQYDILKNQIVDRVKFGKSGDYEGIEIVGEDVFVLRSDGKLYQISDFENSSLETIKIKTGLNAKNNTEGLAYDSSTQSLLIACKAKPGEDSGLDGKRAIYSYSIREQRLDEFPVLLIDQYMLSDILNLDGYSKFSQKILNSLQPSRGGFTFQPSGIAVHPITQNIYVIGSVGKLLLVFNPNGELLAVNKLKRKIFPQPEGICFAPDGTLFISTEGKGGRGKIYQFNYLSIPLH
jgi:uncharacterized protein YjiK